MAQLPKPSDERRRPGSSDRLLPAEGRAEPAPALPEGAWSAETVEWWKRLWASPHRHGLAAADYDAAVRLARVREAILQHPEKAALHPAASQLEDRLGLSPRARRALGWKIAATPPAERPTTAARGSRRYEPPGLGRGLRDSRSAVLPAPSSSSARLNLSSSSE